MRLRIPSDSITFAFALLACSPALAQNVLENLSVGHVPRSGQDVPNWNLVGNDNSKPRVLSDRIILTPPWPGSKRGVMWANNPMPADYWTAELEFRVSGPPGGGGNLHLWYTKSKDMSNGLPSVYNVDVFDGLALVLDQYAGSAGTLRGFLNDGTTNYKSGLDLNKLAFSHCPYPYRNLGRFSKLKVRQASDGLEVIMDNETCFKSFKIFLPPNYFFGISAASAENADSMEISSFIVRSETDSSSTTPNTNQAAGGGQQVLTGQAADQSSPHQQQQGGGGGGMNAPPQTQTQPPQAEDLKSVFTVLQHLQSTVQDLSTRISNQNSELQNLANKPASSSGGGAGGGSADTVNAMARRVEQIEKDLASVKKSLDEKDLQDHLQDLHDRIQDISHHMENVLPNTGDIAKMLKTTSPRLGFFLFVLLAFQGMLAASYIVYKRRRANSPKKLL